MTTYKERLDANNAKIEEIKSALSNKAATSGEIEITENGKHDVAKYSFANVNVTTQPNTITKEITENGTYNAADEGADGYSSVSVSVGGTDMLQELINQTKSCDNLFANPNITNLDFINGLDISEVTTAQSMFNGIQLTNLDLSKLDFGNVTSASYMFANSYLTSLDLSEVDFSKTTKISSMFNGCKKLTSLDLNISCSATDLQLMFKGCEKLETINLSNFKTGVLTNMREMFNSCYVLEELDFSNLDTSTVTDMSYTFSYCRKLKSVKGLDTSSLKTCSNLFYECYELTELPSEINLSKVKSIYHLFGHCESLVAIPKLDTKNITEFTNAFSYCYELTDVHDIDMRNASSVSAMFYNDYKLTNLTLKNIKVSLQIGSGALYGHLLTLDSLLNTIKELHTNTGTSTRTLTVGSANLEKLANVYVKLIDITDEMRAEDEYIDNKLPFEVCESTDEGALHIINDYLPLKTWNIA